MEGLSGYCLEVAKLVVERITEHDTHGRGNDEHGPEYSDCLCRNTVNEATYASTGCGFCMASLGKKEKDSDNKSPEG